MSSKTLAIPAAVTLFAVAAISLSTGATRSIVDTESSLESTEVDSNRNGIDDDIDSVIASMNLGARQRQAAENYARIAQDKLLIETTDRSALQEYVRASTFAFSCLHELSPNLDETIRITDALQSAILISPQKYMKDKLVDKSIGPVTVMFPRRGEACRHFAI